MAELKYNRILLKLGGESMATEQGFGIDPKGATYVASVVKAAHSLGTQVSVVIGGGNLWRGTIGMEMGMDRTTADHMGMIATVMNSLALRDALERIDVPTRVQTAFEMRAIAEPYIRLKAIRHMEKGRVVIFGGGTGNPYFTTDSAGALRSNEINAQVLIKGTKVNGVYNADPMKNPDAVKYDKLSYIEALNSRLKVMDSTAISLCMDNEMPIVVLDLWEKDSVTRLLTGENVGTTIC
ncbi:MAG: UMP kinase [Anaerolineae bacterium]